MQISNGWIYELIFMVGNNFFIIQISRILSDDLIDFADIWMINSLGEHWYMFLQNVWQINRR